MTPPPPPSGTVLGFDYGQRRIGVAVGQGITGTARPLAVVANRQGRADWDRIGALIREWQPAALVVGLPRHLDGSAHELTAVVERFARRLHGRYGLPVHLADERLTSEAAHWLLQSAPDRRRGPQPVDDVAAQLILEGWLRQG